MHPFFYFIGKCGADQFECHTGVCKYVKNPNCDGSCISSSWVKDGEEDCTDGSDESEYWFQKDF